MAQTGYNGASTGSLRCPIFACKAPTARLDCGKDAPRETVSRDRVRGLRIFDITNIDDPKYITNVQTCRGSHTHTVVHDPREAIPLQGTWIGTASDHLAMKVAVKVAAGA